MKPPDTLTIQIYDRTITLALVDGPMDGFTRWQCRADDETWTVFRWCDEQWWRVSWEGLDSKGRKCVQNHGSGGTLETAVEELVDRIGNDIENAERKIERMQEHIAARHRALGGVI